MSPSKSKNLTPSYAVIQGLYWMYFAAIMSFSGFFLLSGGFTNTQIGILAAIAGLLSAVLQPVLAGYADQPQSPSLKKLIQMLYLLQLILVIGLFLSHSLILTGLLYGSSIALLQLMTPFINSLGMESINQGHSLNFGLARGMGSVAYACICYILGIITVKAGPLSNPNTENVHTLLKVTLHIIHNPTQNQTPLPRILPKAAQTVIQYFFSGNTNVFPWYCSDVSLSISAMFC